MHLIVYISSYTGEADLIGDVLRDISVKSFSKNRRLEITGHLFFHQNRFIQLIEGSQESLESLMSSLQRDPRHCDIHRVIDEPIKERSFSGWRMGILNIDSSSIIDTTSLELLRDIYKRNYQLNARDLALFISLAAKSRDVESEEYEYA
ncbi:MAG: BLUF domain-containing protein [Verrucomicrobiota bacterium]